MQVVQRRPGGGDFAVKGLYAAGEAASASVHGANRLGANSLLDLVVFGRACAMDIASSSRPGEAQAELGEGAGEASVARMEQLLSSHGHTPTAALRLESQKVGTGLVCAGRAPLALPSLSLVDHADLCRRVQEWRAAEGRVCQDGSCS